MRREERGERSEERGERREERGEESRVEYKQKGMVKKKTHSLLK